MYKAFQNQESYSNNFNNGVAVIPANKSVLTIKDVSLDNFMTIDHRISNPRILSADSSVNITGNPYSQSQYANYFFGAVVLNNIVPGNSAGLISDDDMSNILSGIQETVAKALSYSALPGISGLSSVFVGAVDSIGDNKYVVPFLVSSVVFYNPSRVTIGTRNDAKNLESTLESLLINFGKVWNGGDNNVNIVALTTEETMKLDDVYDLVDSIKDFALNDNLKKITVVKSVEEFMDGDIVPDDEFNGLNSWS